MLEKQLPYKYRVYDEIKKNILTGHYQPGSVLNERKLSEEMGISRTPIREALLPWMPASEIPCRRFPAIPRLPASMCPLP